MDRTGGLRIEPVQFGDIGDVECNHVGRLVGDVERWDIVCILDTVERQRDVERHDTGRFVGNVERRHQQWLERDVERRDQRRRVSKARITERDSVERLALSFFCLAKTLRTPACKLLIPVDRQGGVGVP